MGGGTHRHEFDRERRRVLLGIAAAVVVMIAAAVAVWQSSAFITLDATLHGRLQLGATAALVPAGIVAVHVARMASRRFNSPDLIAGAAFDEVKCQASVEKAVLSNSIEQAVIAVPTYICLALVLPAGQLVAVPLLAGLFVVGRALFAARYNSGAGARSFGFALTFYPNLAGLAAGAASLII